MSSFYLSMFFNWTIDWLNIFELNLLEDDPRFFFIAYSCKADYTSCQSICKNLNTFSLLPLPHPSPLPLSSYHSSVFINLLKYQPCFNVLCHCIGTFTTELFLSNVLAPLWLEDLYFFKFAYFLTMLPLECSGREQVTYFKRAKVHFWGSAFYLGTVQYLSILGESLKAHTDPLLD